ncbi:MAG: PQQ-dependent sugar dehydrogenase [Verrucomicrobia bacterium]|nr:PQQ-dependent sugar dehydrogenase [Verrucomicrobiota bacterium]
MRSLYSQMLPAMAVLLFATTEPVRAQAAKNKVAPVIPHYDPPDQPFRMAPMPQSTRSIVVPLATNLHLAFDTALLRTHTVWSGKGLALLGPQYGLPKSPFISTNDGTVLWTMPPVFPWAVGGAKLFPAKLPENALFNGVSTKGGVLTFHYEIFIGGQKIPVAESARVELFGERAAVVRRFELGPRKQPLRFLALTMPKDSPFAFGGIIAMQSAWVPPDIEPGRSVVVLHVRGLKAQALSGGWPDVDYEIERVSEAGTEKGNERVRVKGSEFRIRCDVPADAAWFELITTLVPDAASERKFTAAVAATETANLGKPPLGASAKLASSSPKLAVGEKMGRPSSVFTSSYRGEAFPLPKEANLLVGGMDFLPNGDLAVCTWAGDVWIVEGATGSPAAAKYRRFARGLAEPMGLAVRDGKIYVGTKQGLYRLTDTDSNGEADLFECLNQGWGYTGSYNAFVYGPVFDKAGNFILASAGHSGRWDSPYMGWGIRISPDGAKLDAICSGFREPNGIGTFGPDRDVFVSENQGQWMAACKLNHVTPGKFYGHPSAWPAPQEEYGKHTRFDPPAVWFPYKLARSTTGIVEITDDRFGPFKGQLVVGDFQNAIVTRVQLEKVNGEYQGAVWPFLKQFQSGVNRLAYGPDGKLYIGGCQAPLSWKAVAPLDFALERVSYTGKLPFEVKEVHALRDGFELTFTQPVEAKAAADPESYDVTQYGFKYHAKYGSPEFDHDGKENAATLIKVTGATVSPDKLKVRLKLEGWKTGYVTMVRSLDVKNAAGESLVNDTFWYSLNQLPKSATP